MANSRCLLPEILVDIFSRLPVKSVGKCRCLSKTWNACLSTSQFVNWHLSRRTAHQQESLVFLDEDWSLQVIDSSNYGLSREIEFPNKWSFVWGSCDGLVLLMKVEPCMLVLLNPVTLKQQVIVPENGSYQALYYGIGYDRSCQDYAVVKLSCPLPENMVANVVVCYAKTGVWKRVGECPYDLDCNVSGRVMPFVNGAVHWLNVTDDGSKVHIDAFDLADKTFHEIAYPTNTEPKPSYGVLVVLGGCLSFIDYFDYRNVDVWMLKEYGVDSSWFRLRINTNVMLWKGVKPVCSVGDEELLYFSNAKHCWAVYDMKEGTAREMVGALCSVRSHQWCAFEESLVSPQRDNVSS